MNRHVNAIAGRLSLRKPQRDALEILDRVTELTPPKKNADVAAALAAIRAEYPSVSDFEREFPSLCFALATGVGKTRLMGAFIAYLHLAHGINNFFVLAPNLTIYDKLFRDFTPNTPKYVFKGIAEFALNAPRLVNGDNYDQHDPRAGVLLGSIAINIFNISKINSEVRGGKSPRIKRVREVIGESYFDYLAALPDLVLLMDESHRYRASAGVVAINQLKPILGLELTATPYVEATGNFKNVVLDYPLARAMEDGFVKEPAVVTRKDFNPAGMTPEQIESLKLEDGIRLHEQTKVQLETYAREVGEPIVKPFVLVIARDTTHAAQLVALVRSDSFFDGRYRERVIQVDSSASGAEKDENVERLLRVERADEPTEIVVHVNMLKEGWDVTNLYTIVPLRAANARVLIEQSIGRGLRLPYGKRTGVPAIDRLSIVAHDRFQEIIDEASRADSPIRKMQILELTEAELTQRTRTVVAPSVIEVQLGIQPERISGSTEVETGGYEPLFPRADREAARITWERILELGSRPSVVVSAEWLADPSVQASLVRDVEERRAPGQMGLDGIAAQANTREIVAKVCQIAPLSSMELPRVRVSPIGEVRFGYRPFDLDVSSLRYAPPSEELFLKYLRTRDTETLSTGSSGIEEERPDHYIVGALTAFDDVDYQQHADLLVGLARKVVAHFESYLSAEDVSRTIRVHAREIARYVHTQMNAHYWEEAPGGFEVEVKSGFERVRQGVYEAPAGKPALDFRSPPSDKANIGKYVFVGFQRCLQTAVKFQSDTERVLSVILERESLKWFRPARGQLRIFYHAGGDEPSYQPDFVAEMRDTFFILETKMRSELESAEVVAKSKAASEWCEQATAHAAQHGKKPWAYALIPHDLVKENMTIAGLAAAARTPGTR